MYIPYNKPEDKRPSLEELQTKQKGADSEDSGQRSRRDATGCWVRERNMQVGM